jgi:hypothetical protein
MTDLFQYFDAWEPLLKARKAKGLDKWARLQNLSEKLQGKDSSAISFTCSHPSHAKEPIKHLLGSIEGNLHFLMGYGNPDFHVAPYHWQIIDPNVTDEEAVELTKRMPHPSNPSFWAKAGITAEPEGDTDEGNSHPTQKKAREDKRKQEFRDSEAITVQSASGIYTCYPSEGMIYGNHNGHVYAWELVKDSFFTAQNPQVAEAMNSSSVKKSFDGLKFKTAIPQELRAYTAQFAGELYHEEVWPLVKSRFPAPGKVIKLASNTQETLYGVTTPTSIEFYDRSAKPANVRLFDRQYTHFDLTRDGNVPPASLFRFLTKHFKINAELLSGFSKSTNTATVTANAWFVDGEASPGWDSISADLQDFEKSIVVDGDVMKVVRT